VARLNDGVAELSVEQVADGTLHVVVRGELDIVSIGVLQPEIAAALVRRSNGVVVDAADLSYVDSSGLAVLLRLAARHGGLEVRHASVGVRQIIRAAGLATRFGVAPEPTLELSRQFPAELLSVRASRSFVLAALGGVEATVREMAAVLVAELATNAVLHAATPFEIVIDVAGDQVRVEVTDQGGGTPTLLRPEPDSMEGRGLMMVDGLAARWGVSPRSGGQSTTVWFELERHDAAAPPGDGALGLDTSPEP
jgi:anti-anti-sigma factor